MMHNEELRSSTGSVIPTIALLAAAAALVFVVRASGEIHKVNEDHTQRLLETNLAILEQERAPDVLLRRWTTHGIRGELLHCAEVRSQGWNVSECSADPDAPAPTRKAPQETDVSSGTGIPVTDVSALPYQLSPADLKRLVELLATTGSAEDLHAAHAEASAIWAGRESLGTREPVHARPKD